MLVGDGHEVESLSDVRRTDARSAQIARPDGVARSFQVSENKIEPLEAVRTRNLLPKDDWRAALADELEPDGPEMPIVGEAFLAPALRERLTGTGTSPNGKLVWPFREAERVRPPAEPGEEVSLPPSPDVGDGELADATGVDFAGGDVPGSREVSEPLNGVGFILVVEGSEFRQSPMSSVAFFLSRFAMRMYRCTILVFEWPECRMISDSVCPLRAAWVMKPARSEWAP